MSNQKQTKKPVRSKNTGKTAKRLLSYVFKYKGRLVVVLISILASALTGVASSLFLQTLIDDYIEPLLIEAVPNFAGLFTAIIFMAGIYIIGIVATLLYNRLMVTVAQGVLKDIRDEMFEHMQTLPIRYFDTHSHGDIMSRYTNDTDTLRQMISQSLPQMFSSLITIVSVFFAMLATNIWLTLLVVVFVSFMLFVTGKIAGKSAKYFVKQQQSIGNINGYIEEMINGQKVVKVFCHEEKAKEGFDEKNEELCKNSAAANMFANVLMPVMNNLGNVQYILIAIIGGVFAVNGIGGITLGAIASFLQLSKSFTQPMGQISQQLNAVIMALAGAERIFELMDEESEVDDGYVTLVNVKYGKMMNSLKLRSVQEYGLGNTHIQMEQYPIQSLRAK